VKLEDYASILDSGICMPGGVMKKGSLLLERSQVLKGETVPAQEVWEGLPAERIPTPAGFLRETGAPSGFYDGTFHSARSQARSLLQ
jgi:hypothetical protein